MIKLKNISSKQEKKKEMNSDESLKPELKWKRKLIEDEKKNSIL